MCKAWYSQCHIPKTSGGHQIKEDCYIILPWNRFFRIWGNFYLIQVCIWTGYIQEGCSLYTGEEGIENRFLDFYSHKLSKIAPATSSVQFTGLSRRTLPLMIQLLNSKRLCSERVATYGLLHRSPPSSTSSSNFSHLQVRQPTQPKSNTTAKGFRINT